MSFVGLLFINLYIARAAVIISVWVSSSSIVSSGGSSGAEYNGVTYPGEKVSVFDVCGAGDTFLSALVYFYLKYGTIERAIPYANKAAAIAVQNFGTYVLNGEDINEICRWYWRNYLW